MMKKAIEQKISQAEDWELVKKTFIPTLPPPERQKLLSSLLEK